MYIINIIIIFIIMSKKELDKNGLIAFYKADLDYYRRITELSCEYKCKPRKPGMTEITSENMAKIVLNKLNIKCKNAKSGDLHVNNIKYEVKCFTSNGPISFGPTEKWSKIIFIDARHWTDNLFEIYLLELSNDNTKWQDVKMNKKESFKQQCDQKRRPRIGWEPLKKQIKDQLTVVFQGKFEDIFTL